MGYDTSTFCKIACCLVRWLHNLLVSVRSRSHFNNTSARTGQTEAKVGGYKSPGIVLLLAGRSMAIPGQRLAILVFLVLL